MNLLTSKGNDKILEGILANSDLQVAAENRNPEEKKSTKTIDSLLRQGRQVCKALIELHKLGYSHNDVKPANFLKVNKSILDANKANKVSKDGKVHKHRTQLADFGEMTKIPTNKAEEEEESKRNTKYTTLFAPQDQLEHDGSKKAVEKRDVFALGASLLYLLLKKIGYAEMPKALINKYKDNKTIYKEYKLEEYYGGTTEERMSKFLDVIRKMMDENYNDGHRPNIKESLELLKSV